ncbi:amidophosphoribosyltransferase [bacterium]|nr:MAG: amidophosphoribosyltransferase [bacterium]
MCGIIGVVSTSPVGQLIYDGLLVLQHRGQDAAGIATSSGHRFYVHKGNGLVRDVFRTRDMRNLQGNIGIGHARYPTAGSSAFTEAQPLYVNSPYGIILGHNGNLTNAEQLKHELFQDDLRHVNTGSDSEVLLNVLAHEIGRASEHRKLSPDVVFDAVSAVHRRCRGAYAVVALIAGYGLLAFRDAFGIRPLVIGHSRANGHDEYLIASESVALDVLGFTLLRDVAPGEAVFIGVDGSFSSRRCAGDVDGYPCIFEYVYLARPDSVLDGVSVYQTRLRLGERLAEKIRRFYAHLAIDVVIPIPDTSRPAAMELANRLKLNYREGFVKNRYIGRTFIMPDQTLRRASVRQKLNIIPQEFAGKNVLLVDDSIVRGTTSRQIVQTARDAGARNVYFASAAPPVRFPNVYGIDMPSRQELIAHGRTEEEICAAIGADALIYQDLSDLVAAASEGNPAIKHFETSCFDGVYITGDVTPLMLAEIERRRPASRTQAAAAASPAPALR